MNKLLQKLADQCRTEHRDGHGGYTEQFDEEKFAELIIQECLGDFKDRIAKRYQGSDKDRDIAYGMEIVYFEIIDKFGADE